MSRDLYRQTDRRVHSTVGSTLLHPRHWFALDLMLWVYMTYKIQ